VTHFVAISAYVRDRIRLAYGADSEIIYPPVNIERFTVSENREDFYLIVSQLNEYKAVDLAIEAFKASGRRLVVIGQGAAEKEYRRMAQDSSVEIMGYQPDHVVKDHLSRCRAYVFPGSEDFGITPLEAMATGKPVIALGKGGCLETVKNHQTGVFFDHSTTHALNKAITQFEKNESDFTTSACRLQAERFRPEAFRQAFRGYLESRFSDLFRGYPWPTSGSRIA